MGSERYTAKVIGLFMRGASIICQIDDLRCPEISLCYLCDICLSMSVSQPGPGRQVRCGDENANLQWMAWIGVSNMKPPGSSRLLYQQSYQLLDKSSLRSKCINTFC